jgi:hypothetical protein
VRGEALATARPDAWRRSVQASRTRKGGYAATSTPSQPASRRRRRSDAPRARSMPAPKSNHGVNRARPKLRVLVDFACRRVRRCDSSNEDACVHFGATRSRVPSASRRAATHRPAVALRRRSPERSQGKRTPLSSRIRSRPIVAEIVRLPRERGTASVGRRDVRRPASVSHSPGRPLAAPPPGRSDRVSARRESRAAEPPQPQAPAIHRRRATAAGREGKTDRTKAAGRRGLARDARDNLALVSREGGREVRRQPRHGLARPSTFARRHRQTAGDDGARQSIVGLHRVFAARWARAICEMVVGEFVEHYHAERDHQGLANVIPFPSPASPAARGRIGRHERLGGLLKFYQRSAA